MAPGFPLRKANFQDHEDAESSSPSSLPSSPHFLALLFVLQLALSPGRSRWLLPWLLCLEGSPHSYLKGSYPLQVFAQMVPQLSPLMTLLKLHPARGRSPARTGLPLHGASALSLEPRAHPRRVHAFPRPGGVSRGGIAEGRSLVLGHLLRSRSLRRIPGPVPARALAALGVPQTETRAQGPARHSPVNTGHTRPHGHTPPRGTDKHADSLGSVREPQLGILAGPPRFPHLFWGSRDVSVNLRTAPGLPTTVSSRCSHLSWRRRAPGAGLIKRREAGGGTGRSAHSGASAPCVSTLRLM